MPSVYKKLFENWGSRLGVRLNPEEEQDHVQAIEQCYQEREFTLQCIENIHQQQLRQMQQEAINAYRLQRESKEALEIAQASGNNQSEWNKAYHLARMTDEAVVLVLKGRVADILLMRGVALTTLELIPLLIDMIIAKNKDPDDQNILQFYPFWILMGSTMFLSIIISALFSKQMTSMLVPLSTDKVLDTALEAGIELDANALNISTTDESTIASSEEIPAYSLTSPLYDVKRADNEHVGSSVATPSRLVGYSIFPIQNPTEVDDINIKTSHASEFMGI